MSDIPKLNQNAIDRLNRLQRSPRFHPLTCGKNRGSPEWKRTHLDGEGVLVADADGYCCPYCDYRQDHSAGTIVYLDLVSGIDLDKPFDF